MRRHRKERNRLKSIILKFPCLIFFYEIFHKKFSFRSIAMQVNETYCDESTSKADAFHPILILITYIDGEL